jgi:hypothetical protein
LYTQLNTTIPLSLHLTTTIIHFFRIFPESSKSFYLYSLFPSLNIIPFFSFSLPHLSIFFHILPFFHLIYETLAAAVTISSAPPPPSNLSPKKIHILYSFFLLYLSIKVYLTKEQSWKSISFLVWYSTQTTSSSSNSHSDSPNLNTNTLILPPRSSKSRWFSYIKLRKCNGNNNKVRDIE